MKFEEVLPALREGKKAKRKAWEKGDYIKKDAREYVKKDARHVVEEIINQDSVIYSLTITDLEADDWEVSEETKKVKLRDLTEEQYKKWKDDNCWALAQIEWCVSCPFYSVRCRPDDNPWYLNKDIFNDKFLDQEVEIED